MSDDDSLQLSSDLIQNLHKVLEEADPRAGEPQVAVQYLAAVMGYMVAHMEESMAHRQDFLQQLAQFSQAVLEDVESRKSASRPRQPPQETAGVWRPGDP